MAAPMKKKDYLRIDAEHIIHPVCPIGETKGIVLAEGKGIYLKDIDGNQYMDFMSGLVSVNIGHGRKEVADAISAQIAKLDFFSTYWGYSNTANIELADYLAELVPPTLKHFFFCSGGSEATESAFKIARVYWRGLGKDKFKIIALDNAYHGETYGSLSATYIGGGLFQQQFGPTVPGFLSMPDYYCYRCSLNLEYPNCGVKCAEVLADVIEKEGADTVAAFVGEPVHGSAGMIPPPPEYWPKIRKICDKYDVLLIADEVMTGFGRTGKLFALQHWGVVPDIMTMAKGITSSYVPLGAVAVSDRIFEDMRGQLFIHGFTYSGHPVTSAAGIANLKILIGEKLTENAAKTGAYLLKRLQEFREFDVVGDVGGLGLMCGVELVSDKATKTPFEALGTTTESVVAKARENGVLIRFFSDRLGFAPPLSVTMEEIDKAIDIVKPIVASVGT
jgi:putrescine aminotransferase